MGRINNKKTIAAVVIIAVVILAVFNVYLSASGRSLLTVFAQESDELLSYKSEAGKSHESIQGMLNEMTIMAQADAGDSDGERLAAKFLVSMQRDMQWIAGIENEIYTEIQRTFSEETAKELMRKEIAVFISTDYILQLNVTAYTVVIENYADAATAIGEVQAQKDNIIAADFMAVGFADEVLIGTGISESEIREYVNTLFTEFLVFKKSEFDNASSDAKYIEAAKLAGLDVLFTLGASA